MKLISKEEWESLRELTRKLESRVSELESAVDELRDAPLSDSGWASAIAGVMGYDYMKAAKREDGHEK